MCPGRRTFSGQITEAIQKFSAMDARPHSSSPCTVVASRARIYFTVRVHTNLTLYKSLFDRGTSLLNDFPLLKSLLLFSLFRALRWSYVLCIRSCFVRSYVREYDILASEEGRRGVRSLSFQLCEWHANNSIDHCLHTVQRRPYA
jgi:hypothetical protein